MMLRLEIILVFATMLLGAGCAQKSQKDLKDINRVITGIEARKEMELRVIRNELKNIVCFKRIVQK